LIQARDKLSLDDIQAMQMDALSLPAHEFLAAVGTITDPNRAPTVREGTNANHRAPSLANTALSVLMAWDARMTIDSPGAAIYATLRTRLFRKLVASRLGEESEAYFNASLHPLAATSSY